MKKGFTLVELAIVIVIIGFLVAGISGGASLIEQAQLRSIVTNMEELNVAYTTFLAKYNNQKPGDMNTAAAYFPNCHQTQSRCNGDGDGVIGWTNDDAVLDEGVRAMRHLNLAGLISNGGNTVIPNGYANRLEAYGTANGYFFAGSVNNGYSIHGGANKTPDVGLIWFTTPIVFADFRPAIYMASADGPDIGGINFDLHGSITGAQAFYLDKKLDDGLEDASSGDINGATTGSFRAIAGDNGDVCATGDVYDITSDSKGCIVIKALN